MSTTAQNRGLRASSGPRAVRDKPTAMTRKHLKGDTVDALYPRQFHRYIDEIRDPARKTPQNPATLAVMGVVVGRLRVSSGMQRPMPRALKIGSVPADVMETAFLCCLRSGTRRRGGLFGAFSKPPSYHLSMSKHPPTPLGRVNTRFDYNINRVQTLLKIRNYKFDVKNAHDDVLRPRRLYFCMPHSKMCCRLASFEVTRSESRTFARNLLRPWTT